MHKMKYFAFYQNNSGGWLHENKKQLVANIVIVQAVNKFEAKNVFEQIGDCFSGDFHSSCPCCGWRWDEGPRIGTENIVEIFNRYDYCDSAVIIFSDWSARFYTTCVDKENGDYYKYFDEITKISSEDVKKQLRID